MAELLGVQMTRVRGERPRFTCSNFSLFTPVKPLRGGAFNPVKHGTKCWPAPVCLMRTDGDLLYRVQEERIWPAPRPMISSEFWADLLRPGSLVGLELDSVHFTHDRAVKISFNSISCRWLSPVIVSGLSRPSDRAVIIKHNAVIVLLSCYCFIVLCVFFLGLFCFFW